MTWLERLRCVGACVLLAAGCESKAPPSKPAAQAESLTVFAAASTTEVITEAARRYEQAHGSRITLSFGGSSALAQQIKAGAPADVFVSADQEWMDALASAGALQADTRVDVLSNSLVLVAPRGKGFAVRMAEDFDFAASLPGVKRVAVADPEHVPAGRYAQESLQALGWWATLKERLVPAQDVRAALRLVEMGEADAGIVYSTDALVSDKVVVVAQFPQGSHRPISYPVAACARAAPQARAFIDFLRSGEMAQVYTSRGFGVPGR